jgi:hypothetical protein
MSTKIWLGVAGSAIGLVAAARWLQKRESHRALAREDARFHRAYDAVRQDAAHHTPALVLLKGQIFFRDGTQRAEFTATAPASHLLKAAAHAPLGVYALLLPQVDAELPSALKARLSESSSTLEQAERDLDRHGRRDGLSEPACKDSIEVLRLTREFVAQMLSQARLEADSLARFAQTIGPLLLRLTEYATELELSALHAATEAALQYMTPDQRASFEVVVAGAHQARDRSLALQYFEKRFGEAAGEERRVTYAESISGPAEARELIGTRRLDRDIAAAFFGNPARLQRDVLGDAAAHLLSQQTFSHIGAAAGEADSIATTARTRPSLADVYDARD